MTTIITYQTTPDHSKTHQSIKVIADSVQHGNYLDSTPGTTHLGEADYVSKQKTDIVQVVHNHRSERYSGRSEGVRVGWLDKKLQ